MINIFDFLYFAIAYSKNQHRSLIHLFQWEIAPSPINFLFAKVTNFILKIRRIVFHKCTLQDRRSHLNLDIFKTGRLSFFFLFLRCCCLTLASFRTICMPHITPISPFKSLSAPITFQRHSFFPNVYCKSILYCVNFNSDRPKSKPNQVPLENPDSQQNKQISKIKKLREVGLTDDEIVELLEISLKLITSMELKEPA